MDPEAECDRIAAAQHGVISRAQALAAGMSRGVVERRVTTGRWRALQPGVYAPRPVPATWHQRLTAAVLSGGPHACASHRSAAGLWRLDGVAEPPLEISVSTGRRMKGVLVHRRGRDEAMDTVVIDKIRVTGVERTLVDLASVMLAQRTALALDDALRRHLTTPEKMTAVVEAAGRGRRGASALRAMLERRDEHDARTESRLESAALDVLRRHELPLPVPQYEVEEGGELVARLDFAYPTIRLGIEADGHRWHGGRQRWASDIRRENRLKLLGWTVLRFSWEDVFGRPELVAAQVRTALGRNLSTSPTLSVGR